MFKQFSQVKELYALKKQASKLKDQMKEIKVTVYEGNFEMTMRGDQVVESVTENGEERKDIKELVNKALKESQKKMAKKMGGQLKDFNMPGL